MIFVSYYKDDPELSDIYNFYYSFILTIKKTFFDWSSVIPIY